MAKHDAPEDKQDAPEQTGPVDRWSDGEEHPLLSAEDSFALEQIRIDDPEGDPVILVLAAVVGHSPAELKAAINEHGAYRRLRPPVLSANPCPELIGISEYSSPMVAMVVRPEAIDILGDPEPILGFAHDLEARRRRRTKWRRIEEQAR